MPQPEDIEDMFEMFRRFYGSADTAALLLSPDGGSLAGNDALRRVLGSGGRDDGCAWRPVLSDTGRADLARLLAEVLASAPHTVEGALPLVSGDAGERRFQARLRALSEGGRPVAVIAEMVPERVGREGGTGTGDVPPRQGGIGLDMVRAAAESCNVALWYIDLETGTLFADDMSLVGYGPGEVSRDAAWMRERIHPEDLGRASAALAALASGKSRRFRLDCRLLCATGDWKWFQISGRRAPGTERGSRPLVCGGLIDISDRKLDEARLAHALDEARTAKSLLEHREEAHRVATESGGIAPWHIDPSTGEAWWSDHFFHMLGYEVGGFAYTRDAFVELIHPEDAPEAIASMSALRNGEAEEYHADFRLKCRDGSWRWYDSTARRVGREHLGLGPLVCGSMKDIHSRKLNEVRLAEALSEARDARDAAEAAKAELERTHRLLEAAMEGGNVCPWYVDPETDESSWSDQFYGIIGYETGSIAPSGQAFIDMVHPEDAPAIRAQWGAMLDGSGSRMKADFRLRHRDGHWVWCHFLARPVPREAEGRLPLIVGCTLSIAERKEIEERLTSALAEAELARDEAEAARAAAQASQEMLRASATCGEVGPWNVCHETGDGWMMDETFRMMGYEPGDFVPNSDNWRDLIHPEDVAEAVRRMLDIMEDRTSIYEMEKRLRHKDGTYHWYRAIARKIDRSEQGLPYLIAGTTTRIDELKENERRLAEALHAAEMANDRLNRLAENAPGALFEFRMDARGNLDIPYFSANLGDLLGVTREDFEADGSAIFRNIPPEDLAMLEDRIARSRRDLGAFECQYRVDHPKLGRRWLFASSIPKKQRDGAVIWYGNLFDITERLEMEHRAMQSAKDLASAHARLTSIADNAPAGIFELHRRPDGTDTIAYSSARFDELLGISEEDGAGRAQAMFRRVHPEDLPEFEATMKACGETLSNWTHRFRIRHPVLGLRWLQGSASPTREEDAIAWIGSFHDVTNDVEREADLRRAHETADRMRRENEWWALHDSLTDLPNRRYFDKKLGERLSNAASGDGPRDCLLVRIDIDRFKFINDTLGHEAGDAVLRRVGEVLRNVTDTDDFPARVGGDEFTILMAPGTCAQRAETLVERIRVAFREPLLLGGRRCTIRGSFGIAHVEDVARVGADIQAFADAALYRAKEKGRNRFEFFTPELHRIMDDERLLAVEIEDALANDEFVPFFQPQISARDRSLSGVEALLRWKHPKRGLMVPGSFLQVAEQLRVVPELDRIMMEKSRAVLDRLRDRNIRIPKISFNVSSGRMRDPEVIRAAREIVRGETRVAFELLESILVENESDEFNFHLDQVREAGIDIEIDDFGSGHASIIGLMAISPSVLKIDKRIVLPVATNGNSAKLVRAIVEIADTLEIGTTAEGVETPEQCEILREIGCDVLQGYYFARPLEEKDLASFVLSWQARGTDETHRPGASRATA